MPPTASASSLQTTTLPALSIFGFGGTGANRLADDFVVPQGQKWNVTSFRVFGYITGGATVPTAANYRLWCGRPGTAGATMLFDFSASNQLIAQGTTNIFRIQDLTAATNREVKFMDMGGNGIVLGPGRYWLDFNYTGVSFTPCLTTFGSPAVPTGNAVQFIGANNSWQPGCVVSGLQPGILQGLPFEVAYTFAAPAANLYQTNSAGATLTLDGFESNGCGLPTVNKMIGGNIDVNLASNTSGGWELVVGFLPLLTSSGGGLLFGSDVFNSNLGDPNVIFWNAMTFPPFPYPFGFTSPALLSLPLPLLPPTVTLQFGLIDGTSPTGVRISSPIQMQPIAPSGVTAGPNLDEFSTEYNFETQGFDAVSFYGIKYDRCYMSSNGQLHFGAAENDFTPTAAKALTDNPTVAAGWIDLNPATGTCNVTVGSAASLLPPIISSLYTDPATVVTKFSWFDVPVFGTAILTRQHIFYIHNDSAGALGHWILWNELAPASANSSWIGISPGFGVSSDPGGQPFAPAGTGPVSPAPTHALYKFGTGSTVWGTVQAIIFTPIGAGGSGGYNWAAY